MVVGKFDNSLLKALPSDLGGPRRGASKAVAELVLGQVSSRLPPTDRLRLEDASRRLLGARGEMSFAPEASRRKATQEMPKRGELFPADPDRVALPRAGKVPVPI